MGEGPGPRRGPLKGKEPTAGIASRPPPRTPATQKVREERPPPLLSGLPIPPSLHMPRGRRGSRESQGASGPSPCQKPSRILPPGLLLAHKAPLAEFLLPPHKTVKEINFNWHSHSCNTFEWHKMGTSGWGGATHNLIAIIMPRVFLPLGAVLGLRSRPRSAYLLWARHTSFPLPGRLH